MIQTTNPESAVREVILGRITTIGRRDCESTLAPYADDVVSFDVLPPLQHVGRHAVARRLDEWLGSYEDDLACAIEQLVVAASGDVAFGHGLCRLSGTQTSGTKVDMWVRLTVGLRERDGEWRITHEHMSDPLDPETGKARTDLRPE